MLRLRTANPRSRTARGFSERASQIQQTSSSMVEGHISENAAFPDCDSPMESGQRLSGWAELTVGLTGGCSTARGCAEPAFLGFSSDTSTIRGLSWAVSPSAGRTCHRLSSVGGAKLTPAVAAVLSLPGINTDPRLARCRLFLPNVPRSWGLFDPYSTTWPTGVARSVGMAAHVVDRLPDCRNAFRRVFLGTGDKSASDGVLRLIHDAHHARFLAALGRGDHDDALSDPGAVPRQGAVRIGNPAVLRSSLNVVEAAVRAQQFAAATTHASALAEAGVARLSPRLALQVASAEALVAPDERAAELFQAALDIPGIDRWPFEVARVQLAFGERLRRPQATRASREQLTTALDTFTRLGARPWAERASAELRATGQTRHRSDGSSTPRLTPQELGIAELAATGLTNKQIGARLYLSSRTVSAHLYRVFPKLGITSRAALRDALHLLPP